MASLETKIYILPPLDVSVWFMRDGTLFLDIFDGAAEFDEFGLLDPLGVANEEYD